MKKIFLLFIIFALGSCVAPQQNPNFEKNVELTKAWFENWEKTGLLEFEDKNKDGLIQYDGYKTNEMIKLSNTVAKNFDKRELDVLLSSGEQITCALLAGALIELNINAKSWMNWQIPILTEGEHSNARIINMNTSKINDYLKTYYYENKDAKNEDNLVSSQDEQAKKNIIYQLWH